MKYKVISTTETLFDDEITREQYTGQDKINIMANDPRNDDYETFWCELDKFLEFGKTYRITIEEINE